MPEAGGALNEIDVHLVRAIDDCLELKRWLGERREVPLGIDTETTGIDIVRDQVRLVQVGDDRTGWAIPAEDWRGFVREILQIYDGEWTTAHAKFDRQMLRRYCGVAPENCHDVQILSHLKDPLALRALKDIAGREVDPRAAQLDQRLEAQMAANKWTWATVPIEFPTYWSYGALDPVLTVRSHVPLHREMVDAEQKELYQLELAAQLVCESMESRGIRVDTAYALQQEAELDQQIDELRDWCQREYGFSIGSNVRVAERLQYDGWVPDEFTKSGAPSLSKKYIGHLDHPLAKAFLKKKQLEVRAHNFFRNISRYAVMEGDGEIIHPSINNLQAKTGRMSVSDPSLQNQPRLAVVRNAFIARDGHRLVAADFAQIELRLLAHFGRIASMIRFFREGRDMMDEVTMEMFGVIEFELRQAIKGTLYALIYGAQAPKISQVLGKPIDEAQAFLDRLFGIYPEIPAFLMEVQDAAVKRSMERPWITSPMKRRYYVRYPNHAYKLVNYLIQGEAGIAFKRQMIEVARAGLLDYLVLPVHDELVADVPEDMVEEATQIFEEAMPDWTHYRVPLEIEVSEGMLRWGEKYEDGKEPDPIPEDEEEE